jgi:hypothetical protein
VDWQLAKELEESHAHAAHLRREVALLMTQVNATKRMIEETRAACDRMSRRLAYFYACGSSADRDDKS